MIKTNEHLLSLKRLLGKAYRWGRRELSNRYRRISYQIWWDIKQISFKNRKEKIRGFDEILRENPNIYFTTDLVKTGFTDQLMGFTFLYKTGKGLGLKYCHTPLSSHRSSDPFLFDPLSGESVEGNTSSQSESSANHYQDVFDFLGLNDFLEKNSENLSKTSSKKVNVNLRTTFFRNENVNDYASLIEEMKVMLYPLLNKRQKVLIIFQCDPSTYFKYYKYVCHETDHQLDYRGIFKGAKRIEQKESRFKANSHKIMVHIRQGDTGIVKTPWGTFIPTWYQTEGKFTQFKDLQDIPEESTMHVEDFHLFLKKLFKVMDSESFSTVVYSDGFKKAFRWIYQYSRPKDVSTDEIKELKKLEPVYDEIEFGKFHELKSIKTRIGEEVEKLYELINSFFEADIIIVGTQGIMLPKLMATYGDKKDMPLLIILYHRVEPSLGYIGFDESSDFLLCVNLDDFNVPDVAGQIEGYLKQRENKA